MWNILIPALTSLIDKLIPDPQAAAQARQKLAELDQAGQLTELSEAVKVIVAEASSGSWLAANWRPLTMLSFVSIIVNNYILFPYLQLLFGTGVQLDIPPDMWDLLKLGIGGYVIGRTVEKGIKTWKQ